MIKVKPMREDFCYPPIYKEITKKLSKNMPAQYKDKRQIGKFEIGFPNFIPFEDNCYIKYASWYVII